MVEHVSPDRGPVGTLVNVFMNVLDRLNRATDLRIDMGLIALRQVRAVWHYPSTVEPGALTPDPFHKCAASLASSVAGITALTNAGSVLECLGKAFDARLGLPRLDLLHPRSSGHRLPQGAKVSYLGIETRVTLARTAVV